MKNAEAVVAALLDGKVGDWLSDRWEDVKTFTGIGQDSFGLGKPKKNFKPSYGPVGGKYKQTLDRRRPKNFPPPDSEKPWDY